MFDEVLYGKFRKENKPLMTSNHPKKSFTRNSAGKYKLSPRPRGLLLLFLCQIELGCLSQGVQTVAQVKVLDEASVILK